jgi:hypothetical protein
MRAKEIFQIILAFGFVFVPLTLVARSPQASHSQAGSANSGKDSVDDAAVPTSAPADNSSHSLSSLAWLEGRWRGEWGPRVAEQVWLSPRAGAMEGMFRLVEADKTLVVEYFTLVQKPDGIAFYFRHFTPSLAPWEKSDATTLNLVSMDGKKFEFENPANGMPKSSILTRVDQDTYISHSEIVPETGDSQIVEITYKRQLAATAATSAGSGAHPKKP